MCAQTVAQLVDDDAHLQVTVSVREHRVPEVHAHAAVLPVRWGREVRVVVSRTVLRIGVDGVVPQTTGTASKVVLLEVTRDFVEAVPSRVRLALVGLEKERGWYLEYRSWTLLVV
jgi:hypothetical protein